MTPRLTRRRLLFGGAAALATAAGVRALSAAAGTGGWVPPDIGGVFGASGALTYAVQRLLTSHQPLAREFSRSEISRIAPVNGDPPENDDYQELLFDEFQDWRLTVDGLVTTPSTFSLNDLQRMPRTTHITMQACEEGWSFIAEWSGVMLGSLLRTVGVSDRAKYVVLVPYDQWWDSIDMADAWHPQTLLAYGMNGRPLEPGHGAPLRLRVTRQLGYKSIKYLRRITVVDSLATVRTGHGSLSPDVGYSWYAGI